MYLYEAMGVTEEISAADQLNGLHAQKVACNREWRCAKTVIPKY